MKQIKIYTSRKKSFGILILALIFAAGSVWMVVYAEDFESKDPIFTRIVGIVGVLFCAAAVFACVRMLVKNRLFLTIDGEGIDVDPACPASEKIAWVHIEGFSEISIRGTKIIVIHVNNPDYWIEREKSTVRLKMMKFNLGYCGSPFGIGAGVARISHVELWKLLNDRLELHRGAGLD
jgi:hypothetical protein